jgi:hypothetical protein
MMKKKYILPSIEVFEMETESVAALSKVETGSGEVGDGDDDGYVDAMSNKRRPGSPWSSSWDTPAWGTEK